MLPELKRRPGLETWKCTVDKTGAAMFDTYDEFMKSATDGKLKGKMTEGHWPPENAEQLNLPRWHVRFVVKRLFGGADWTKCSMRIYPHLQDSGGFFVAVLEKKAANPVVASISSKYVNAMLITQSICSRYLVKGEETGSK